MLHPLSRVVAALGILLLTIGLAELALAGVRLLLAERPQPAVQLEVPESFWSSLRAMTEQAGAMGLR